MSTRSQEKPGRANGLNWILCSILLAIMVVFQCWRYAPNVAANSAEHGYTPVEWTYTLAHPENFRQDWPSGIATYNNSLIMRLYPFLYRNFNIEPETTEVLVLGLEYFSLAAGILIFLALVFGKVSPSSWLVIFLWLTMSSVRDICLANWRQPYFAGLYYNITDALRLVAIALAYRKMWKSSLAVCAFAFLNHPTMALVAFTFVFGMAAADFGKLDRKNFMVGCFIAGLICLSWILSNSTFVPGSVGAMQDVWFALIRYQSSHLGPFFLGFLGEDYTSLFLPFVAFLFWFWFSLNHRQEPQVETRPFIVGSLFIIVLVICGFLNAAVDANATVTKLALHRSNELIVLVGMVIFGRLLCSRMVSDGPFVEKLILAMILVTPFFTKRQPFSVIFPLAMVGYYLLFNREFWDGTRRRVALAFCGLLVAIPIAFSLMGFTKDITNPAFVGIEDRRIAYNAIGIVAGVAFIQFGFHRLPLLRNSKHWCRPVAALVVLVVSLVLATAWKSVSLARAGDHLRAWVAGEDALKRNSEYLALQKWVSHNTPPDSLFLMDPAYCCGWRAYSLRSSYGSAREWLYTTILYSTKEEQIREGLARAKTFGLDVESAVAKQDSEKLVSRGVRKIIQSHYYSQKAEWFINFGERTGVDFAVFDTRLTPAKIDLPLVYSNSVYKIHALKPLP